MELTAAQRGIVEAAMAAEGIPGVAVAVVRDGALLAAEGFGLRDIEQRLPMTPDTVQAIASVTKSFTAVCVMQLVEAGKLTLDEPVVSYLPQWRIADAQATRKITPRMLLGHKSGMGRTGHQERMFAEETCPFEGRAGLLAQLGGVRLQTPPNAAYSYCNEGYATLGALVDLLGGMTLEERMQRHIFAPLGMSSSFTWSSGWREVPERATGYLKRKEGVGYNVARLPADYSPYAAGGGIASNALDLARYQIATMDYAGSPLLSAGALDAMHSVNTPYGDTGWGYGMGYQISWSGGRKVISHGGGLPGVATFSIMLQAERTGVVVITNMSEARVSHLAEQLLSVTLDCPLFRDSVDEPVRFRTAYQLPAARLSEYAGCYALGPMSADVTAEAERLRIVIAGAPRPMVASPIGDDLFFLGDGGPLAFQRDADGQVCSLLANGVHHRRVPAAEEAAAAG